MDRFRVALFTGCLLAPLVFTSGAIAQNERRLTDSVNIYTLAEHVQTLASAGGHHSRVKFTPGGDSAAAYIRRALEATPGLTSVRVDTFFLPATPPYNTVPLFNVIAELRGTLYPESVFVIGAHYDCSASRMGSSVWNATWQTIAAPGADDNATGVAIMLESARILANPAGGFRPGHTILFAGYGSEESNPAYTGSLTHAGSRDHAARLVGSGARISGMVSVDMVGYNPRWLFTSIITNANSLGLAGVFRESIARNSIGVYDSIANSSGATYSDHDRFWAIGARAVCLMEYAPPWESGTYYRASPLYHTSSDSFGSVNMDLVRRVGQMTVASAGRVAGDLLTGVEGPIVESGKPETPELLQNYPNPFNPSTVVPFRMPARGEVRLAAYDLLGREVAVLYEGVAEAGEHAVRFDGSALASAVYYVRMASGRTVATRPVTLLR